MNLLVWRLVARKLSVPDILVLCQTSHAMRAAICQDGEDLWDAVYRRDFLRLDPLAAPGTPSGLPGYALPHSAAQHDANERAAVGMWRSHTEADVYFAAGAGLRLRGDNARWDVYMHRELDIYASLRDAVRRTAAGQTAAGQDPMTWREAVQRRWREMNRRELRLMRRLIDNGAIWVTERPLVLTHTGDDMMHQWTTEPRTTAAAAAAAAAANATIGIPISRYGLRVIGGGGGGSNATANRHTQTAESLTGLWRSVVFVVRRQAVALQMDIQRIEEAIDNAEADLAHAQLFNDTDAVMRAELELFELSFDLENAELMARDEPEVWPDMEWYTPLGEQVMRLCLLQSTPVLATDESNAFERSLPVCAYMVPTSRSLTLLQPKRAAQLTKKLDDMRRGLTTSGTDDDE